MEIKELLIMEWKRERESTKKMLERVPADKLSWKPHEKSKTLGELSMHVASLPGRWSHILEMDVFDPTLIRQSELSGKESIMKAFEESDARLTEKLDKAKESEFGRDFTFSPGGKPQFTITKAMGIGTMLYGHLIHHRAQLSVYLRLLDVPVPGMYGKTADE